MKLHALLALALTLHTAAAAPKKPAPAKAVQAQPAVPATPATPGAVAKPSGLISSDMSGRDVSFIAQAIDLGKGLTFLAEQTAKTTNPRLQSYGADLLKTLATQEAMLGSAAEMRGVKTATESAEQQKYIAKFANYQGAKLEKSLLDAFIELDQRIITAYEANAKSSDPIIAKFVADALPASREHLAIVQSMSGISPKRPALPPVAAAPVAKPDPVAKPEPVVKAEPAPAPEAPKPTPPARPAFRTNIPAPIN